MPYATLIFLLFGWLLLHIYWRKALLQFQYLHTVFTDQADRDNLTGLWNRAALLVKLRGLLTNTISGEASALLIDVDDFKGLLRAHGQKITDGVIVEIARILICNLKGNHFITRFDREEFVVVLDGFDGSQAMDLAEFLRQEIENYPDIKITACIGVCDLKGVYVHTPEEVLSSLTQAVHLAKMSGKNRVHRGDAFIAKIPKVPKIPKF